MGDLSASRIIIAISNNKLLPYIRSKKDESELPRGREIGRNVKEALCQYLSVVSCY